MGQISSAPVELIRVQRGGGASWRGAVAEMQGWRADHEDAHFMRNGGGNAYDLFGVLDGHGGSEAARLAAHQKLPELLRAACGGASKAFGELEKRVAAAFVETDAWLRARPRCCGPVRVDGVGARENRKFLRRASRTLATRGASSCGVRRAAAAASDDHKPDRDDEMRRIADAGASPPTPTLRFGREHAARLDGNLAAAGLGDFAYKKDLRLAGQQKVSCARDRRLGRVLRPPRRATRSSSRATASSTSCPTSSSSRPSSTL
ncbi:manganese ion binding protein [Aureococcus anophagefferens]|nr:manganese ion binding protein [Aureococcus anophagefferens]